jgi:predicted ATPase
LAAELHSLRGEPSATADLAAELLPLSVEYGSAAGRANATMLGGWALIMQERRADGLADVEEGVRLWRQTGSRMQVGQRLVCAAEAFMAAGQPEMACVLVEEGLAAAQQTGRRHFQSELCRLKGELLLALHGGGRQDDAAASLQQALIIARTQDARLLELRAATSLARLWRLQDRQDDAGSLLAPVYGWFTEGFDLPDLKAAKALL